MKCTVGCMCRRHIGHCKGRVSSLKGRTYEQIHGQEKAIELKTVRSGPRDPSGIQAASDGRRAGQLTAIQEGRIWGSQRMRGRSLTIEHKEKLRGPSLARSVSASIAWTRLEYRKKRQESLYRFHEERRRALGLGPREPEARGSIEYYQWRRAVLKRDGHCCVGCGTIANLEIHHIKSQAEHPGLRFDVNNGITLCFDCHCDVDDYRARFRGSEKELR